jgi:hypothetical protein
MVTSAVIFYDSVYLLPDKARAFTATSYFAEPAPAVYRTRTPG